MTRTRALTLSLILQLCVPAGLVALLLVANTHAASADTCDPAYTAQCCACEPSGAAEPAPLPRIYLPTVQRSMPPMSSEFTPVQPVPTVTPDPPVTGDVQ
jgi:hypothetical protein